MCWVEDPKTNSRRILEPSFKELELFHLRIGAIERSRSDCECKNAKLAIAKRLRQKIDCEASAKIASATENSECENSECENSECEANSECEENSQCEENSGCEANSDCENAKIAFRYKRLRKCEMLLENRSNAPIIHVECYIFFE